MIYWKQGEKTLQRKCQERGRCTIAFKLEIKGNDIAPIEFKAVTRETNIKLEFNSLPAIHVKPSHYRDIIGAVLDYPGMQEANSFLAPGYYCCLYLLIWCIRSFKICSYTTVTKLLFHWKLDYLALEGHSQKTPRLGGGRRSLMN